MNNTVFSSEESSTNYSSTLTCASIEKIGNYALAKSIFSQNPNTEVLIKTFDGNVSIIPLNEINTLLIPSEKSLFETCVNVRESKTEFKFEAYDLFAEKQNETFANRYKHLISNNILSPKDTLSKKSEQKEYEIEKTTVEDLLINDNMHLEEFLSALTQVLENHPLVYSKLEPREITPYDVIPVLEELQNSGISLETACYEISTWSKSEFNELLRTKNKYSLFAEITGLSPEDDE